MSALLEAQSVMREAGVIIETLRDERDELHNALGDLLGLVQLIGARADLPADFRDTMLSNHRFIAGLKTYVQVERQRT